MKADVRPSSRLKRNGAYQKVNNSELISKFSNGKLEGAASIRIAHSGDRSVSGRSSEVEAGEPDGDVVRGVRRGVPEQSGVPGVDVLQ